MRRQDCNHGVTHQMPNHVHGIITINKPHDAKNPVETQNFASLPTQPKNKLGMENHLKIFLIT